MAIEFVGGCSPEAGESGGVCLFVLRIICFLFVLLKELPAVLQDLNYGSLVLYVIIVDAPHNPATGIITHRGSAASVGMHDGITHFLW